MNNVTIKTISNMFEILAEILNFQKSEIVTVLTMPDFQGYAVLVFKQIYLVI